jgi:hypothetical protein
MKCTTIFSLQPCLSDALVYDLYALTPAEIKIVESASAEAPARQGRIAK